LRRNFGGKAVSSGKKKGWVIKKKGARKGGTLSRVFSIKGWLGGRQKGRCRLSPEKPTQEAPTQKGKTTSNKKKKKPFLKEKPWAQSKEQHNNRRGGRGGEPQARATGRQCGGATGGGGGGVCYRGGGGRTKAGNFGREGQALPFQGNAAETEKRKNYGKKAQKKKIDPSKRTLKGS